MLNTFCPGRGSNQDLLRGSQTLYRVAIKACLYRKAVQVCIIPNIPTVPLATNGTIGKITNGTIGRTPNKADIRLLRVISRDNRPSALQLV